MLDTGIIEMKQRFESIVEALTLSLQASSEDGAIHMLKVIEGLRQNIEIMQRLESDVKNNKSAALTKEEVSEIGDHALMLLDEVATGFAARGLQEQMILLHQLSLPVVQWLSSNAGKLIKIDIVVNAVASYANTLQDTKKLEALCGLIETVIAVTDETIKQDLEATNPMRPWRVLNLNWGIVATRTHNTEVMEHVFEQLINNIPADAQQFFIEGVQQMDVVGYPQHVRVVMEKYASRVGSNSIFH